MKKTTWPGNWKVTCDVCGFWYPSSEVRERWDGLIVCKDDWETRHPQTLIKINGETAVPAFIRSDPPDVFVHFCDIQDSSSYADMATADCARAGNITPPYQTLYDLNTNGHE